MAGRIRDKVWHELTKGGFNTFLVVWTPGGLAAVHHPRVQAHILGALGAPAEPNHKLFIRTYTHFAAHVRAMWGAGGGPAPAPWTPSQQHSVTPVAQVAQEAPTPPMQQQATPVAPVAQEAPTPLMQQQVEQQQTAPARQMGLMTIWRQLQHQPAAAGRLEAPAASQQQHLGAQVQEQQGAAARAQESLAASQQQQLVTQLRAQVQELQVAAEAAQRHVAELQARLLKAEQRRQGANRVAWESLQALVAVERQHNLQSANRVAWDGFEALVALEREHAQEEGAERAVWDGIVAMVAGEREEEQQLQAQEQQLQLQLQAGQAAVKPEYA